MPIFRFLLLAVIFANVLSSGLCEEQPINKQNLEREITKYALEHNYSGSILIQHHDKVLMYRSFGKADQQFNIRNRPQTKNKLASITKLFTAVLILQLYDQGRIDLHQPIKTYLPNYKGEGGNKVTIYHLLTATSGIENYDKNGLDVYLKPFRTDELLNQFCSGKLENEPGKKFNYNNADFVILGKIIEQVSGKSYEEVLQQFLLRPLHLANTGLCTGKVVPSLAYSYSWNAEKRTVENDVPYRIENFYSAGAMYATTDDLRLFSNALYDGKLLKLDTLKLLLKPQLGDYACGLWIYDYDFNGVTFRVAERQGSIGGTTNRMLRVLEKDVTILLLTNMDSANLDDLQVRIMSKFVTGTKLPEFQASIAPSKISGKVGNTISIPVTLTNKGGKSAKTLLDIEIKDDTGAKIAQIVKEDLILEMGESRRLTFSWTPIKPGNFTVSLGVFQSNWRINYLWMNSIATLVAE